MSDKTVNYTDEQTSQLVEAYEAAETENDRLAVVKEFAEEFGKTAASVRSKLVREGVYIKKTYKTKNGKKAETKEAIVKDIAQRLGVDADSQLSGLEKATKNCLQLLRGTIDAAQKAIANE